MDKTQKMNLIETILRTCLFSEYLPSEFSTELLTKEEFSITSNSLLAPVTFSMDKFNDFANRRFISIPEITSYISAVHSLSESDILSKIITLNNHNTHSMSKILTKRHEVKQFSDGYGFSIFTKEAEVSKESSNDFLANLNIKLEKSKSCRYILHLDIANFFNSIYTHNISAITKGEVWANEQFQLKQNGMSTSIEYNILNNIDKKITEMNLKRTHGLLIGPRLSFIIAESLLTQIDYELDQELRLNDIDFVRYVDDYDVFIKTEKQIKKAKDTFNQILQRYGLIINDAKTKLDEFPFYTYIDYETIIDKSSNLSNLYAQFGQIEKNKIQNGAILYFCENILSKHMNSGIALSLSFSILKNISKALISSCKNIFNFPITNVNKYEVYNLLVDILEEFSKNNYDLECIWVVYTLLKLFPEYSVSEDELYDLLNEPALVVYMYESQNGMKEDFLKDRAKECGWLLNYELFFNNIITESEFKENLKITDVSAYQALKDKRIHFYIKKT